MRKKIFLMSIVLGLVLGTVGCAKDESKETVDTKAIEILEETEEKKENSNEKTNREMVSENQNSLTGLIDLSDEAIGKRPVAVMVNNVNDALPQYGISDADIMFEMTVEGDLTRMMALYADYTKVPVVCAVRSCRYYYPVMANGFDAFYVNWGFDETIREYVDSLDVNYFDGMVNPGNMFGRDENRLNSGYALEHTAYFDGTKFAEYVDNNGYRTELLNEKQGSAFVFNGLEEQVKPNGDDCKEVNIDFGAATATFSYDEESNTYLKQINGQNQMDAVTDLQLAFTNVFVLETDISVRTDYGHKQIDWQGGDDSVGYYISNGCVQKITWEKTSENAYLKFYDEDGKELSINRGKSYIAFNYANQTAFQ